MGYKLWKPRIDGIDRPDEAPRQHIYFMEVIMSDNALDNALDINAPSYTARKMNAFRQDHPELGNVLMEYWKDRQNNGIDAIAITILPIDSDKSIREPGNARLSCSICKTDLIECNVYHPTDVDKRTP